MITHNAVGHILLLMIAVTLCPCFVARVNNYSCSTLFLNRFLSTLDMVHSIYYVFYITGVYFCTHSVPEVVCSDPVSADGIIMVQWSYVHTGGLNLTSISAVYSYVDGTSTVTESVTIASLDTTSVEEHGLVAGFVYTFNITAENSNGSSTVSCRPTPHIIGEYTSLWMYNHIFH